MLWARCNDDAVQALPGFCRSLLQVAWGWNCAAACARSLGGAITLRPLGLGIDVLYCTVSICTISICTVQ